MNSAMIVAGTFIDRFVEWMQGLNPTLILLIATASVFMEGGAVLGLIAPGEVILLLTGFLASTGRVDLTTAIIVLTIASFVGDQFGYWLGTTAGVKVRNSKLGKKIGEKNWAKADDFLHRRGALAIFGGKFVGFLRSLLPFTAGLSEFPYRRFVLPNACACAILVPGSIVGGYLAGNSYKQLEERIGFWGKVIFGAVVVALAVRHFWKKRQEQNSSEVQIPLAPETDTPSSGSPV